MIFCSRKNLIEGPNDVYTKNIIGDVYLLGDV